jgi:hypothetical protein
MAGKRRSRHVGQGMTPLFALEPFTAERDERAPRSRAHHADTAQQTAPGDATRTPVSYTITGTFRFRDDREHTRTVQGHTVSTRMEADIGLFVAYLCDAGWLFADGRAVLVRLLSVCTEDGVTIPIENGQG